MPQLPIDPLADDWFANSDYRPKVIENYTSLINAFTRWIETTHGVTDLSEATTRQIKEYLDLRKTQVHVNTVRKDWTCLHSFYKWLADEDGANEIEMSPMRSMKGPKVIESNNMRVGSDEHFAQFLANTDRRDYEDFRMQAMFAVMFLVGPRIGSVLDLNVEDFTDHGQHGTLYIRRPKNDKPHTAIVVPEAHKFLKRWMRMRKGPIDGRAPLFTIGSNRGSDDGRLTYTAVSTWLDRYRVRTGHDMPPCHAWRRAGAIKMLEMGVDPIHVETQFGWKHDNRMVTLYTKSKAEELSHNAILSKAMPVEGGAEERGRQNRADRNRRYRERTASRQLRAV